VVPVAAPVIGNGVVVVQGSRVAAIGKWPEVRKWFRGRVADLGDVALLPGLVNAHCHLDYTGMAGHLPPMRLFTDWLKLITELKAGWEESDYLESWLNGAGMLLRTGTTTVGDIEAAPALLPGAWNATPLRMVSFLEMIGITGRRSAKAILQEAADKITGLPKSCLHRAGLSPHAPYSTLPDLLRKCASASRRRHWRVSMHIAESELEYRMFMEGRGPMHQWMRRGGRDMVDCGKGSPLEHAARCGLLSERLIAVHANYLCARDYALLSSSGAHVAHCPRSHEYFEHRKFPLKRLLAAGVNVCLGTDSLASVLKRRSESVELNMFDEIRALLKAHPEVSPKAALRMATLAGAKALGLEHQVGELSPGACADIIAVPVDSARKPEEVIAHHRGPVAASMIAGKWVVRPEALRRPGKAQSQ
jgi:cytosine/adenosine deaminase-related metal-dependent hydrolase